MGAMLNVVEIPETARKFSRVCEIIDLNDRKPARLIPILQQIQEEYRYLPEEVLALVATSLDLPPSKVYGVATFYSHFTLEPKGKHTIRLCDGTACHVRGSNGLLEVFYERLGLSADKTTTDDMMFTVETVSCLGACGLAPVIVVDEKVHGQVTSERAVEIVDEILEAEQADEINDPSEAAVEEVNA